MLNSVDTTTDVAVQESGAKSRVRAEHALAHSAFRESIALVFVGSVVPDDPRWNGSSFNAAAQMFQRELLLGLEREGLPASLVVASRPVPSRRHTKLLGVDALPLFVRGHPLFGFLHPSANPQSGERGKNSDDIHPPPGGGSHATDEEPDG